MPGFATRLLSEFPAGRQKQQTLDELNGRFSGIRAGFLELAGPLAGPTTLSKNDPAACGDATPGTSRTTVAVDNRSSRPVVLTLFDGSYSDDTAAKLACRWGGGWSADQTR